MKLLLTGQPSHAPDTLLPVDRQALHALCARQMLVRPEHRGLAEFPIDPARPELNIGGSVLAFNPEVKHDEAIGLKMVSIGADGSRTGLALNAEQDGLVAHLDEGQPFGLYLFTPTPNTAVSQHRFSEVCFDGGRMVQVSGTRRRSLVCAVRLGENAIANDANGELPVPLMMHPNGFPRTYLASSKRQSQGILLPGPRGYEATTTVQSKPLVFGENVADETPLTVAVLEYLEHEGLETGPVDLRSNIVDVLQGTVGLEQKPVAPKNIALLQAPQKRLLTGMRVLLRKTPPVQPTVSE